MVVILAQYVYVYEVITLYILNILQFCQLLLNRAGKKCYKEQWAFATQDTGPSPARPAACQNCVLLSPNLIYFPCGARWDEAFSDWQ